MSYKNLEQQQSAVEKMRADNAKEATRADVYRKYPAVKPCKANDKCITEICDRWLEGNPDVLHDLGVFEAAIQENPSEFDSLAKEAELEAREGLTDKIIETLSQYGKGHDAFSLKQERTRLKAFSVPMLRDRLADLQMKAHMAGQSVQTLKQIVADAHRDDRKYPGFPDLDKSIGAAQIKAMSSEQLKKLVRHHSAEQVNARLAGRN